MSFVTQTARIEPDLGHGEMSRALSRVSLIFGMRVTENRTTIHDRRAVLDSLLH